MGGGASKEDELNPTTDLGKKLYEQGYSCSVTDKNLFEFQTRQLTLINYALTVLSRIGENKTLDSKKAYEELLTETMTYQDAQGHPDSKHDWKILSESFLSLDPNDNSDYNTFKQFEMFFSGLLAPSIDTTTGKVIAAATGGSRRHYQNGNSFSYKNMSGGGNRYYGGSTIPVNTETDVTKLNQAFLNFRRKFRNIYDTLTREVLKNCV
jgi:hypothetical protein